MEKDISEITARIRAAMARTPRATQVTLSVETTRRLLDEIDDLSQIKMMDEIEMKKTPKPVEYFEQRLGVFEDSLEIASMFNEKYEYAKENGEYDYLSAEARDHILGLWEFTKECVAKIKELKSEK